MNAINTPYATLSFQNIFTPRPRAESGPAVYSCSLIFDPAQQKSPQYKAMQDACIAAARKEWGDNISPWSKNKPGVVDVNRQDVLLPEEVWSGQLVRANITPFAWTHTGKKGVSFGLNHIQIIQSEGRQRLDGRPTAKAAFDDGEVAETEDVF
jgi:hypothetical protein